MNKSLLAAAAVAGLMASACSSAQKSGGTAEMATGECHGLNSCKGQGECGGVGHMCAGKNSCKGQGWVKLSKSDCDTKSGKFKASAM